MSTHFSAERRLPPEAALCQNSAVTNDLERARNAVGRAIATHWPGASIKDLAPVPGDASARRYVRAALTGGPGATPGSVVVMLNEGSGAALSSDELGVFGKGGPAELPFVNVHRYLARLTDAVPAIYTVTAENRELVLEDVGDVSLWQAATEAGADTEACFARALDLLAEVQAAARDDGSGCYALRQAFDARLFDWEFDHFLEYGVAGAPAAALEASREELRRVSRQLDALPRVFTHRDWHAWNLHVQAGRVRVIDFQDALLAPAMYDVASLLTDRITPSRIDAAMENRLVARFAATSPAARFGDVGPFTSYRLCALQRVLKVVGRFNYLAEVKGKPRYATMLPAIVPTARRLCAGRPELTATSRLLADHVKGGPACAP
jgi:aminoglycoside/choline kinase family phosphotransferase